ncbi:MAG: 6-bladed beta-propeller [bacterium]|nr:6-bladed beta-propeller [bacterium]
MKRVLFLILTLLLFIACSEEQIPEKLTYDLEIFNGVKHIHNLSPKWVDSPEISLDFTRKIGDLENENDNYMFYHPQDICVDSEGNLYVLDTGNTRIQKFNKDKEFMATIGSKGQGPGEFSYPGRLHIDNRDVLYVYDRPLSRFQLFNSDGSPHSNFSPFMKYMIRNERLESGNFIIAAFLGYRSDKDNPEKVPLLQKLDAKAELIAGFGERFEYNDQVANVTCNSVRITHDKEDNIYISMAFQNRIEKYSPEGQLIFKTDRPLNYEVSMPKSNISEGNVGFQEKLNFVSEGLGTDDKNRIWVLTFDRQEKEAEHLDIFSLRAGTMMRMDVKGNTDLTETDMFKLEVFDNEGILLAEFPLSHFCDVIRVFNDKIYIIDTFRGMCIYEYSIIDNK